MGGAVTTGRDNNDLIDNLVKSDYIRTILVEKVFRAVDRADYMLPEFKQSAYKDVAYKDGVVHLSAPCIYSDVMESLKLSPGLSFLNLGSGTGYLSTMAGLILGVNGINHGIEVHPKLIDYANNKLNEFIKKSSAIDAFDFCFPKFIAGNCLCLSPTFRQYDRVYCGAGCPKNYEYFVKNLIKVGGILVMPLDDNLLQIKRLSDREWASRKIQCVSFATLITPTSEESKQHVNISDLDVAPASLQILCRSAIRNILRNALYTEQPSIQKFPLMLKKNGKSTKRMDKRQRTICIPIDDEDSDSDYSMLHNLNPESGSHEMNVLLNLVLSMGNNAVAGGLRDQNNEAAESTLQTDSDSSPDRESDSPADEEQNRHTSEDEEGNLSASQRRSLHERIERENAEHMMYCCGSRVSPCPEEESMNDRADEAQTTEIPVTSQESRDSKLPSNSRTQACNGGNTRREKFDSGLGDDDVSVLAEPDSSSPSTTNGSGQVDTTSEECLADNEATHASQKLDTKLKRTHRQRKRHYTEGDDIEVTPDEDSSDADLRDLQSTRTKKMKKKCLLPPNPCDIHRDRLSKLLKEKVQQLPLPPPLKIFVNMNRDF